MEAEDDRAGRKWDRPTLRISTIAAIRQIMNNAQQVQGGTFRPTDNQHQRGTHL
ncbi:hypothetical protein [Azospirillum largimobile]